MYHYNAFISYNHNSRDIRIASKLQSQLENYRIPKGIQTSTGLKKIERVFLDKGELEVAGDLNEVICDVLEDTDYLIVICSPESKKSIWVKREIEYFLRNHSIDSILTVITEGEPFDVLPEILFRKDSSNDTDAEAEGEAGILREPLSCDYRQPARIARNVELPRLVAALIGCKYDDLVQRQRHYRNRRITIALAAAAVILMSAVTYLIWSNNQIRTSLETSLREQSMNLSTQSEQALSSGDRISALRYAVEALPSDESDRPVVPEAVLALSRAMNLYRVSTAYSQNAVRRYPSNGSRHLSLTACKVNDRVFAAELYTNGRFVLWDTDTGKEIMPDYSSGLKEEGTRVQNLSFSDDGKLILITGNSVKIIDPLEGKELKTISFDGEYFKIYDNVEFKTSCDSLAVNGDSLWIPVADVIDHENYDELTVRHNSLALLDAMARFSRDSDEADELALYNRRRIASDISYRIIRLDLSTGKTAAETSAPNRPTKIRTSPDGKYIAACYSDYYDGNSDGSDDRIVIMKSDDLTAAGSIESAFISDFGFDKSENILLCGFDKKPVTSDFASSGRVYYTGKGKRTMFSFTADRELVLGCYDAKSFDVLWSRKEKINAGGIPRLMVTAGNTMLSNAIVCTVGNTILVTNADGKDIACLHALAAVKAEGCNKESLVSILDDGSVTTWKCDENHNFSSSTGHNVLLGPIIDCIDANPYMFVISTDSDATVYKEILTQYQNGGLDTKLEAYEYDESSDSSRKMEMTDADYYKDSFVEIHREPSNEGADPSDKVTEIIVRDVKSGKILMEHDAATSARRTSNIYQSQYTDYLYSGIDREKGKAYFIDNNDFRELSLMSVDLEDGTEKKIMLNIKVREGLDNGRIATTYFDILRPVDMYSAYEGTAGDYDLDSKYIYYPVLEGNYFKDKKGFMYRIAVLAVDPETGETNISGINDYADEFDNNIYYNVRLNAASGRLIIHENSRFKSFDFSGKEIWTGDELAYDPIGFTCTDDGSVVAMEKTGTEAVLHIYSPANGKETVTSDLGSVVILSNEKMDYRDMSDEERMVIAGDDAYLLDSKTWELRSVISDNYIAYSPETRQFMLGDGDKWDTGHVPYRTLKEMIAEAKESLED